MENSRNNFLGKMMYTFVPRKAMIYNLNAIGRWFMHSGIRCLVNTSFLIMIVTMGFLCSHAFAQEITKPYTFSPNTPAKSSEVNENFDVLFNNINKGVEKVTISRQEQDVNSSHANSIILTGYKYVQGNSTPTLYGDVTFNKTFNEKPIVIVTSAGVTNIDDTNSTEYGNGNWKGLGVSLNNITFTGFQVAFQKHDDNVTFMNSQYHWFTWIAIGQTD